MSDVVPAVCIRCIRVVNGQVLLEAEGVSPTARCPSCGTPSDRVHGRYQRRPLDLPWRGRPVRLALTARRFRCAAPGCARKTFVERFEGLVLKHARRTVDATRALVELAEALGGEAGARLADALGLPVSPDTLLRSLRQQQPVCATPRVLGVDDFALRRGHRYRTILIDLETRRPVDLLSDRLAGTLAEWLRQHPGVEIVARDRSGAYAEGARAGAPEAIQVADRFHLLMNASEALDELLRSRRRRLEYSSSPDPPSAPASDATGLPAPPLSRTAQRRLDSRVRRSARWEEVQRRRAEGQSIQQIAKALGMGRRTVRRLLAAPLPPTPAPRPRPAGLQSPTLQPFVSYLQDRWQAGCSNVRQLFRELTALGYQGSYSLLEQSLLPWRPPRPAHSGPKRQRVSLRWLCLRPPDSLSEADRQALERVLAEEPDLARGYQLKLSFATVVAERDLSALQEWLLNAQSSGLAPFVAFANGFRPTGKPSRPRSRCPGQPAPSRAMSID